MYQTRSLPSTADAAKPNSDAALKKTEDAPVELNAVVAPDAQRQWVVDTIPLAEYEAQLKARGASVAGPIVDPAEKDIADAYFASSSHSAPASAAVPTGLCAQSQNPPARLGDSPGFGTTRTVAITKTAGLGSKPNKEVSVTVPVGLADRAKDQSTDAVSGPETTLVQYRRQSSTEAKLVSDQAGDLLERPSPVTAPNAAGATKDDLVNHDSADDGAAGTTKDASTAEPVATVAEVSNPNWISDSGSDPGFPFLLTISIGVALAMMFLMLNLKRVLFWFANRREYRAYQKSSQAHTTNRLGTGDDGSADSVDQAAAAENNQEGPAQQPARPGTFRRVQFPKRTQEPANKTIPANQPLDSDQISAQESAALVKANDLQRDSVLQAKIKELNERLSAQSETIAKLESALRTSKNALNTAQVAATDHSKKLEALESAQAQKGQREAALSEELAQLKEELENKTAEISELKSSSQTSSQTLADARLEAAEHATQLLADLDSVRQELSAQKKKSTKLEADLAKAREEFEVVKEAQKDLELEQQKKVEGFKEQLSVQENTITTLKSNLATSETALERARTEAQEHKHKLQAQLAPLEEELSAKTSALSKSEAELSDAKKELAEQLAAKESEIARLEKERSGAAVNRQNYIKLAKKVVRYKKLYQTSDKKLNGLMEENARISDRSDEHKKHADRMREELTAQQKLVDDLKQHVLELETAALDLQGLSEDNTRRAEGNESPARRTGQGALALKETLETIGDNDAFFGSDRQLDDSQPRRPRVNRPR